MKRIVDSKPDTKNMQAPATKPADPAISDISIDGLIGDGLLALYREVKNLLMLSARGKLDPNAARDLRDHLKMLFEIKDREKELLAALEDTELEDAIK